MKKIVYALTLLICVISIPFLFEPSTFIITNKNSVGNDNSALESAQDAYFANEQWVLNQTSQQHIVWNNHSLEGYAQDIIDSFEVGTWKEHSYTPTIRSTFHAINALNTLGKLNTINPIRVTNFLLNRYNSSSGLFSDSMSGLLPYSTSARRVGYSEIEATAYSIIILEILDALDLLTSAQMTNTIYALRSAINGADGGFCHSPTGDPESIYEGSSLLLSYYCYSALSLLHPQYPLSIEQQNSLVSFVSSRQNMDTGDLSLYGGYMDTDYSPITTIESTYYAVKLLDLLGELAEISSTALIHHIETLEDSDSNGIYNTYHPSKTLMPQPEFFSTSLALDILQITGIGADINTTKCQQYIEKGFNTETFSWHLFNSSSVQYLKDQMLILEGLQAIGQVNTSNGNEEFINDHCAMAFKNNQYEIGYTSLRKSHGSITGLYQKITFLREMNKLSELHISHKNAIMSYLDTLIVSNTVTEIPNFNPLTVEYRQVYGFGLELSVLPFNVSHERVFGRGIHQIYMALRISELIGTLSDLNASVNFHDLASEILSCQTPVGFFKPYSSILLGSYESILLTLDALRSLSILDSYLGTSYLESVNDATLKTWVLSLAVFEGSSLCFQDGNTDSLHTLMVTNYVWEINSILSLGIFGPVNISKLQLWIEHHPDMPLYGNNFSSERSFFAVILHYSIVEEPIQVYLPRLLNAVWDFFGSDSSSHFTLFISNTQYEIMKICLRDWYSTTAFASIPDIQVGYKLRFDMMSSGFSYINYANHNLTITLPNKLHSSGTVIDTSHIVQFQYDCALQWYPNFTIQVQDNFMDGRVRTCNFTIYSDLLYVVDITGIPSPLSLVAGDTMSFSIAVFLNPRTGSGSKPLNCSAAFTVQNETTEIVSNVGTVIDGKYIIMVTINTTVLDPDEYIVETVLSHDIFQYEPGYIGNTSNLTRSESTIRILNSFIITGEKPKVWRLAALGGVVSISGIAFGVTGYVVYRKVKGKSPKNKEKRGKTKREVPFNESFKLLWVQSRDKTKQFITSAAIKIKESAQTLVNRIQSLSTKRKGKNKFIAEKPSNPFFIDETIVNPSFLKDKPNPVKELFDMQKKKEKSL